MWYGPSLNAIDMNTKLLSDDELMNLIDADDRGAFTALYERHRSWILRLLLFMLRDQHYAETAVNDVFIKVKKYSRNYIGHGKFPGWAKRMAINTGYDFLRSSHTTRIEEDIQADKMSDTRYSPEVILESNLISASLRKALRALPEYEEQILIHRFLLGMSVSETSEILDIPVGTVKSKTHYAIKKLKDIIREK